jgi:hypothetical protein
VIYSFGRFLPVNIAIDKRLRAAIHGSAADPVNVFDEFFDVPRFSGDAYLDRLADLIRVKYREQPSTVIIAAVGEKALDFVVDRSNSLFPHTPVVHMVECRLATATPVRYHLACLPMNHAC